MSWQAIPLRAATVIDSPLPAVRQTVLQIDLWRRAAAAEGFRLEVDGRPDTWAAGQRVRIDRLNRPMRPVGRHRAEVDLDEHGLPVFTVSRGPGTGGRLTLALDDTGAGVLMTVQFAAAARGVAPGARLRGVAQSRHRRPVVQALRTVTGFALLAAHQTTLVVAGAIFRDGAVLAARRTYPAAAAGQWEFPGGKVGPGENPERALVRELAEELGVAATVGDRLGPEVALDVELVLRLHAVTVDEEPAPSADHDEIRWLGAADLDSVPWLAADRELLPAVRAQLMSFGGISGPFGQVGLDRPVTGSPDGDAPSVADYTGRSAGAPLPWRHVMWM